ncbi:MAG: hypothetical protein M1831_001222 [Alyxoria varia]|nr:MAG: hypothetical protein M1831_001222 [Alyxoria varia]
MNDPVKEIEGVIRQLTQTTPSKQRRAIETYFTKDAAFTHPICRTGSFDGSRYLIRGIYRWYKIMSPRIDLQVNSIAYDAPNQILYVNISQVFRIFFVPFYAARVNLTTVLHLIRRDSIYSDGGRSKYYINCQNDLYQINEIIKFALPFGGPVLVWVWQILAALVCLMAAVACWPVSLWEEHGDKVGEKADHVMASVERRAVPEDVLVEQRDQ